MYFNKISPVPSLFQTEVFQLSQPLLLQKMLRSPNCMGRECSTDPKSITLFVLRNFKVIKIPNTNRSNANITQTHVLRKITSYSTTKSDVYEMLLKKQAI